MIDDEYGLPFPEKSIASIAERYTEHLCRSWRDTKWNLTQHILAGWTTEQHRHWVETGEEPV